MHSIELYSSLEAMDYLGVSRTSFMKMVREEIIIPSKIHYTKANRQAYFFSAKSLVLCKRSITKGLS